MRVSLDNTREAIGQIMAERTQARIPGQSKAVQTVFDAVQDPRGMDYAGTKGLRCEVADARTYGVTNFARDILAVADNMERALKALDDEIRDKADAGVKALLDGVELTERELIKVMEKHGVKRLEPQGQKFDPNLHQAMFEIPDPRVPAGTVVQVMQPGYTIGERVLRPALVGVSKGGPKAPAGEAPANDNRRK